LHDALANLCQLFAATVGEDDVKLFKYHVQVEGTFKGTIVEIPVSSDITYEWSQKNLDVGRRNGRDAAQAAFDEYMDKGGPQRHRVLRIIGEQQRIDRRRKITEARRAEYSRS
jgi:hypothetical protein